MNDDNMKLRMEFEDATPYPKPDTTEAYLVWLEEKVNSLRAMLAEYQRVDDIRAGRLEALEKENKFLRRSVLLTVQQRCEIENVQNCHICNSMECGDNFNPLVKQAKESVLWKSRAMELREIVKRITDVSKNETDAMDYAISVDAILSEVPQWEDDK